MRVGRIRRLLPPEMVKNVSYAGVFSMFFLMLEVAATDRRVRKRDGKIGGRWTARKIIVLSAAMGGAFWVLANLSGYDPGKQAAFALGMSLFLPLCLLLHLRHVKKRAAEEKCSFLEEWKRQYARTGKDISRTVERTAYFLPDTIWTGLLYHLKNGMELAKNTGNDGAIIRSLMPWKILWGNRKKETLFSLTCLRVLCSERRI